MAAIKQHRPWDTTGAGPAPGNAPVRVAYFPDAFHEVNGVAHTSRHFVSFARRRGLPFLCVRAGAQHSVTEDGSVTALDLPRGPLSFHLEKDLGFDLGFWRHLPRVLRQVRRFGPDVIHITGPSELGMLGAWIAHYLHVPLAASWHTNIHEYAATRGCWLARACGRHSASVSRGIRSATMGAMSLYYRRASLLFAPNPPLCAMLQKATNRPCYVMPRGVDRDAFSPAHRTRSVRDGDFVLGFVGRLSVEKNVALLATIAQQLSSRPGMRFRFLIVGHGGEERWLRTHLPGAEFAGVLRGPELARAYANMDLFVFPSHTDTFGNAVLEALASGVPAIVTPDGGPACIVREGETGMIRREDAFAAAIDALAQDAELHAAMRHNARCHALAATWDAVFAGMYAQYQDLLGAEATSRSWHEPSYFTCPM